VFVDEYQTMIKILNYVNCESMNQYTKIYSSETPVGFLFNLYLGISFCSMYSRYSDVSLKNDTWCKIWIRSIKGILMMLIK
jgi:hypothetical protein